MRGPFRFTTLEEAGRGGLARLGAESGALPLLQAQWAGLVGSFFARRTEPAAIRGGCLTVRLLDPAGRRIVREMLPELEKKVRGALPAIRSLRLE